MTIAGIGVCCPYCASVFDTGKPDRSGYPGPKTPAEIECLPYTRDIGRFDPKTARDRTSPAGWSQVCKDFMTWLGFQRIGILRQEPGQTVDVMYRVQYCPNCKRLFDIYANYTPGRKLAQIWPHLFALDMDHTGEIARYNGTSWPVWITESLTRLLRLPKMEHGVLVLGLLLFLIGFLPWLFPDGLTQSGADSQRVWMTLAIYGVAAVGITALLIFFLRFLRHMQTSDDFYDLFRTNRHFGVGYWYNYTVCRFVGVQTAGKLPQISQVEVWGSGLALSSIALVWVFTHAKEIQVAEFALAISGFVVLIWLFRQVFRKAVHLSMISTSAALVVLFGIILVASSDRLSVFRLAGEILFWSVFAYIVGMSAWVGMSATLYVLKGVTRIPMRISPLTQYKELKPLLGIQQFSTSIMAVLFITLVSLVFLIGLFSNTLSHLYWMVYWVQLALAVLFAAIAVGIRPVFLFITTIYLALTIYLYSQPHIPAGLNIGLSIAQLNLIVFGGFLTFIMYFHLHEGRMHIDNIVATEKEEVLDEIDRQINKLRAYATLASREEPYIKDKNEFFEYTQGLHGLDALLNLRRTVQAAQFRSANFVVRVIGPLLWSIVLPSVWDLATRFLMERWVQ